MSGIDLDPAVGDDAFDAMGQFTNTVAGDVRDPYPALAQKRRGAPVEIVSQMDFGGEETPVANVYTYDTVAQVLRDNVAYSSGAIRELMEVVMGPFVLVGMDEPEHKRHRALVSAAFRHKSLVRWESDVIEPIMHDLIDSFAERGRAELVREFTFRFPVQIIAEILGVPHEDHEKFHEMAIWVVNVAAKDHTESFLLVENGRAQAFVLDDILLAGQIANARSPKDFMITGESLRTENQSLMLRKDDPEFKALVDRVVGGMMKSGEMEKLYHRWFMSPIPPKNININYPLNAETKDAFANPSSKGI